MRALRCAVAVVGVMLGATAAFSQQVGPEPLPGDRPPPTPFTRLAESGDAEEHEGFDHLIVLDETVNRIDERGVTATESYVLYKVLTEAGCRELSALRWGYDPQSMAVTLTEATILRDGERIPVPVEQAIDLPAPQTMIYWRDRIQVLQLPRLEVGDGIEVRTERKGFTYALLGSAGQGLSAAGGEDDDRFVPPMEGEYFDIVVFAADVPTVEKRYELHLPAGKRLHSEVYNGALYSATSYDGDGSVFSWWGLDLPAVPHEPRQPDRSDFVTKVVLATVESWEAKSRWFFSVNDGQFDSSPEIDAKIAQILDQAGVSDGSDDAKAEVLLHWVAQNIRYSGQTMGEGEGFTLHPGTMIFEQRSGVCKDIAGMLVTMLRAADIPAYPAMTMAGSRIEEVPADQFNHCVVARRVGDGYVMYDPTWVPFNNDIWSKLETEQHYLIGSPEGETLARIPYSPPDESPLLVRHRARLLADGSLSGSLRLEGSGAVDGRLRRLVSGTARRRLHARVAQLLVPMSPRVEILGVRHHGADDFSADMWLEADYEVPGFAMVVDDGLELVSPSLAVVLGDDRLFRAGAQSWSDERRSDVLLYSTQLVDVVDTIELPTAYTAADLPAVSEVDETYAGFEGSAELGDGVLTVRSRVEVRRRQILPTGYPGFLRALEAARDWSRAIIRLEGGGR